MRWQMQTGLLKPQFYSFVSYVQFSYYHETQKMYYKVDDRDQLNRICEFTPNLLSQQIGLRLSLLQLSGRWGHLPSAESLVQGLMLRMTLLLVSSQRAPGSPERDVPECQERLCYTGGSTMTVRNEEGSRSKRDVGIGRWSARSAGLVGGNWSLRLQ